MWVVNRDTCLFLFFYFIFLFISFISLWYRSLSINFFFLHPHINCNQNVNSKNYKTYHKFIKSNNYGKPIRYMDVCSIEHGFQTQKKLGENNLSERANIVKHHVIYINWIINPNNYLTHKLKNMSKWTKLLLISVQYYILT